jgi:hypothetical protein
VKRRSAAFREVGGANSVEVMIQTRGLTKRYGATTAVDGLGFDVRPGAVTGFLGPNGSGKSMPTWIFSSSLGGSKEVRGWRDASTPPTAHSADGRHRPRPSAPACASTQPPPADSRPTTRPAGHDGDDSAAIRHRARRLANGCRTAVFGSLSGRLWCVRAASR